VNPLKREFRMRESLEGGLNVTGVLDRLDEDPSGRLIIVDYKSGKAPSLKYGELVSRFGGARSSEAAWYRE
jgi:putative RecB family exonuclease